MTPVSYFLNSIYGDELMIINIALALTSAVFLMAWVTGSLSVIFHFMPGTTSSPAISGLLVSGLLFITVIEFLSIISFFGSVLFLLEARKTLPRWYLAFPLCFFLALLVVTNLFIYFDGKPFLGDPINTAETLWLVLLALLSPSSVLFFMSLHADDSSGEAYVPVSSAASIFAVFLLFIVFTEISRWKSVEAIFLPLAFYWTVLMPATGVCFLSKSSMYRENNDLEEESGIKAP